MSLFETGVLNVLLKLSKYYTFQWQMHLKLFLFYSNRKIKWVQFEYQNVKIIRK